MTEETLFHEALARSDPRDRAAFLDAACAGRPDLRSAVDALLAVHESAGDFLAAPAVADWSDAVSTNARAGSTDPNDDRTRTADPLMATTVPTTAENPPAELPANIGRYAVRSLLGHGGMGTVYLAHDPELDRLVALKVPKLGTPAAEERFLQEARAAAAVSHPNLCPVFDAGRADGVLYLAMAYVPGETLGRVLRDRGRFAPTKAASLTVAVAHGMAEAHRHAIVHRDLKPGNILMDRRGEPVVTDFGLARRDAVPEPAGDLETTAAHDPRITQAGAVIGTPAYMSPEQARGDVDRVGPASDVYSLGAILFEMLTGRTPFRGDTVAQTLKKIETDPVPPLPGVPAGLAALCRRALARDPADRPASMEAFAAALAPFAAGHRSLRWIRAAVAAAAVVLLIAAGVVLYVKTDNGTIEVHLSDPTANVEVTVDGDEVRIADGGRVTKLRAGKYFLQVRGEGFETESQTFAVKRGERTVLEVHLKPNAPVAPGPAIPQLSPDKTKLAGLLVRAEQLIEKGRVRELEGVVDEALQLDSESPTALGLRANIRRRQGDVVRARADAEAALKLNPETPWALVVLSDLLAGDGKIDEGIALETIVIRLRPNLARGWTSRAKSYLDRKDYRQTIVDATRAIELESDRPNQFLNRGSAYALLGKYDEAIADYDAAARIAENDPRLYDQRAMVHARLGNKKKAEADWLKAEDLDHTRRGEPRGSLSPLPVPPKRKKLTVAEAERLTDLLRAAETAQADDRAEATLKAADQALAIDPTAAAAHVWRARALNELGRYPEAEKAADTAVRLDPTDPWAYIGRGIGRGGSLSPTAGIADLTIAVTLAPDNPTAWSNRGYAYSLVGQYHQGVADLTEAVRLGANAQIHTWRADCYVHLGEYEKALADYSKAVALSPGNARWRMNCAVLRARLGDVEGAQRDREAARKLDKNATELPLPPVRRVKVDPVLPAAAEPAADRDRLARLLARGDLLIAQGRYVDLKPVVDEAVAIDPESPGALGLRASFKADRLDWAGAKADVEAALKLNPETFQALLIRVFHRVELKEGTPADCIADLTVATRLRPTNPIPWANRALMYLARNDYRQAVADATKAIELGDKRHAVLLTRGAAYAYLGESDKALADYAAAAGLAPDDPRVFIQRSAVYAGLGKAAEAAADWQTAARLAKVELNLRDRPVITARPKPPGRKELTAAEAAALAAALVTGEKAWDADRFADALKAAEEACRIDPTSAPARAIRARGWGQTDRLPEAIAEATEALRLDPTSAEGYAVRGVALARQKDYAGAIADDTIALQLAPKRAVNWNNRGFAYLKREQYHQAVADLDEALRLRPNQPMTLANRGACFLSLGEYRKALADFEAAAQYQPTVGRWPMACAVIKARLGDTAGADRDRAKAIAIEPRLKDAPPPTLPPAIPPVKVDPVLPGPNPVPDLKDPG